MGYGLAAPMLFESKADGSLAAHATQAPPPPPPPCPAPRPRARGALPSLCSCRRAGRRKGCGVPPAPPVRACSRPRVCCSPRSWTLSSHALLGQTNLRLVEDGSAEGMTVRHDHSLRRALNRGRDYQEGPQAHIPPYLPISPATTRRGRRRAQHRIAQGTAGAVPPPRAACSGGGAGQRSVGGTGCAAPLVALC